MLIKLAGCWHASPLVSAMAARYMFINEEEHGARGGRCSWFGHRRLKRNSLLYHIAGIAKVGRAVLAVSCWFDNSAMNRNMQFDCRRSIKLLVIKYRTIRFFHRRRGITFFTARSFGNNARIGITIG